MTGKRKDVILFYSGGTVIAQYGMTEGYVSLCCIPFWDGDVHICLFMEGFTSNIHNCVCIISNII